MKVVFLALAFPHMSQSSYLYTALVTKFKEAGHDITVVAPAYEGTGVGLQQETGVKVLRVKTLPQFGVNFIRKGIANIALPYQYKRALKSLNDNLEYDLIIMPTPPISLYNIANWLKKKSNAKVYLILRDIFPQNAVDLGIIKKKDIFYRFFKRQERRLYEISDKIGCMSQGNVDYIREHNPEVSPEKLHLLPNWADMAPFHMDEKEKEAVAVNAGIVDKFVVIFGGNIGRPQKMKNIIDLAIACQDIDDILFLIYGQGAEYENLVQYAKTKKANNIELRKSIPHHEFIKILHLSQVGLISLSEDFTIPNIPSKALSYYNAKIPILASIDLNTDFGQILEEHNTGVWAEAGNVEALKQQLMVLYNDKNLCRTMGENGYQYMCEELSTERAFNTILKETNNQELKFLKIYNSKTVA